MPDDQDQHGRGQELRQPDQTEIERDPGNPDVQIEVFGKRWAWDSGINITFRIGAGWAGYKVSSNSTDPNVQMGVDYDFEYEDEADF